MNKINVISNNFKPDINLFLKNKTNLYIDFLSVTNRQEKNILWLCEPDVISKLKKSLDSFYRNYDYILTFDKDVLNKYPNAILHLQASSWVEDKRYEPKDLSISMVVGGKLLAEGHFLRQEIWHKQENIRDRKFYVSAFGTPGETYGNPTLPSDKKDCLFNSMFHISIENCSIENYFSEKILDCFISKTVPIYWGCKNIDKFFDKDGIIFFESAEECVKKCNILTKSDYEKMLPNIEKNYVLAQKYKDWNYNLIETIKSLNIK